MRVRTEKLCAFSANGAIAKSSAFGGGSDYTYVCWHVGLGTDYWQ
jgi:hypothetical protein